MKKTNYSIEGHCGNCRYYHAYDPDIMREMNPQVEPAGECRRTSPINSNIPESRFKREWPIVFSETDWCGKYEKAKQLFKWEDTKTNTKRNKIRRRVASFILGVKVDRLLVAEENEPSFPIMRGWPLIKDELRSIKWSMGRMLRTLFRRKP